MSGTATVTDRPILSLADLEAHDPGAPSGGTERRFKCPICTPAGRHLALNTQTGAWWCHRCLNYGLIRERWTNQPGVAAFRSVRKVPRPSLAERLAPKTPEPEKWGWRAFWDNCEPVRYTPGSAYLRDRGIDEELAYESGIRYADRFEVQDTEGKVWPRDERCIVFPFRDRAGHVVAINIRFIDVSSTDQKRKTVTLGPRNLGAFMGPVSIADPLRCDPIVVVEGPIDALSLTMAGVPALALVGTAGTGWLPEACVLKNVAIALDNDERGQGGAERLMGLLRPVGARMARWRPELKDWNDDLRAVGPDSLRERIDAMYVRDFPTNLASVDARSELVEPTEIIEEVPADVWAEMRAELPDDFDFNEPESTLDARTVIGSGPCRSCSRDNAMIDYRGPEPICMFHKGSPV